MQVGISLQNQLTGALGRFNPGDAFRTSAPSVPIWIENSLAQTPISFHEWTGSDRQGGAFHVSNAVPRLPQARSLLQPIGGVQPTKNVKASLISICIRNRFSAFLSSIPSRSSISLVIPVSAVFSD